MPKAKVEPYAALMARLVAGERKFAMTRAEYAALLADPAVEPDFAIELQHMVDQTDILITDR